MPDAIITSTESTFGTISGTFAADQSTIVGTVAGSVVGTLTGSVGVPGAQGPAGIGLPAGGASGQFLQKTSGADYATDWVTVNLSGYVLKANNLSDLTNLATARDNLGLGSLSTPTFAGVNVPGSGTSVANLGATFLTINQQGSGQFTIQPSQGIVFPDATVQTTAFTGAASTAWGSITGTLSSQTDLQTALNLKAPLASPVFTGDARAVTAALGDNDTSIATTAFVQQELLSGTANARNLEVYVRNQTGSTIPAGSIVYINGATGNRPTITLAQANNDANSAQTFGFVKTTIANNGFGFVIVRGELENIDTSALTEGVQLYLSPTTPGTWTTTKPSAPQHLVYVGIVVRAHPTQGVVLVAVQNGYELNELHDVQIVSPTNGQVLKYDSATNLWKNGLDVGGVAWGGITGTLSAQTDLQTALDGKYPLTGNPSGFITSSALTGYATESWVTAGFYPLTGNPSGFITSSALTPYLTSATAASTYQTLSGMSSYLTTSAAASTYYPLTGNPSGFITSAALSTYAPLASPALTGNVSIVSNSTGAALFIEQAGTGNILTLHDQAADTNFVAIDANGKVSTIPSVAGGAGFNIAHGTAPTTPVNGDVWTTTSGLFARINGATRQYVDLDGTQTINGAKTFSGTATFSNANNSFGNSTAAGTTSIASGATISGALKAVNLGTSGVAGSTTTILIGSTTGTSTTTLNGTTNGVTVAADTNSVALATTAYVVGQAGSATPLVNGTAAVGTSLRYARQDHVHPTDTTRAPLASPALTGTPTSSTAATDTNTTQIATTAFVIGQAASATPSALGTAAVGTSLRYARADHVHPNPLPTGGTTAQVLSKVDGTNYNVQWTTVATGGGTWGSITGTLSSQTDLQSALNAKLDSTTAASTYQTISGMSSYLTTAAAAAGYYPLTGNPSGFLTSAPVTSVAGKTGAVTLVNTDISGLGTMATATAADYSTTTVANGLYYPLASNPAGYLTSAPVTSVAGRTGAITLAVADVSGASPLASPAFTGTPTAPTATAGTNTTQIATTEFVRADNNCKVWVNFNGTGTVAIRASYNVSSITDNGAGDYTVNFTNALADTNYAAVGLTGIAPGTGGSYGYISFERLNTGQTFLRTSSSFRFNTTSGAANLDSASLNLSIFR